MNKILGPRFFNRPALEVAPELLGKYLVRKAGKREEAFMITDIEAYLGPEDKASHARHGRTLRNAPMWGPAGGIYVYFCYGVHWMLNLVVGKKGDAGAILIRGVEGATGPGRVAKLLQIDKKLSGAMLGKKSGLWVEDRGVVLGKKDIKRKTRVGVAYAGVWAKNPWRFVVAD